MSNVPATQVAEYTEWFATKTVWRVEFVGAGFVHYVEEFNAHNALAACNASDDDDITLRRATVKDVKEALTLDGWVTA